MSKPALSPGAVVQLKGGGPFLTVARRGQYGDEVEVILVNNAGIHKAWVARAALLEIAANG